MAMRRGAASRFSQVPQANVQRSSFDRTSALKTTFDSGYLIPIFVDEVLPGDTFNLSMEAFGRLATPIYPFMDNLYIDTFFFEVPLRQIWDNFQRFMGEKIDPNDSTEFVTPKMTAPSGGYGSGSLSDYFGIPVGVENIQHVAFWHRAYNWVFDQWFRDQNLVDPPVLNRGDGPDDPSDYVLLKRGKRHDYFTSALPWPQKGPAVTLPLGTQAPVEWEYQGERSPDFVGGDASGQNRQFAVPGPSAPPLGADINLWTDLTEATAATINTIRQAVAIQQLLEQDARGGTRYTELIKSHFGVTSPDARMQRPIYLGGGTFPINVNPIAQTSESSENSPQGNLAAMGTLGIRGSGFTQSFTEHSIILGLACVRADLTYQEGLNRMFSRSTRYDYFWPELASIGEQVVHNREIYAQGTPDDEGVFGYQERHAEYRYKPSMITGKFRSADPQSLDIWHLAQDFENLPVLGQEFIEEDPPVKRVIATPDEPDILFDALFRLRCARPMPMYAVPGLTRF